MRASAKKNMIRVLAKDGEVHFVLREHVADEEPRECICLKNAEFVKFFKREASKPLLLMREE